MNKILFLTTPSEDYLADGILHGLRTLYGADVVDYPKCEPLYRNCPDVSFARVRGCGFTLYRTLEDIAVDRWDIAGRLRSREFDWVVFGNIYRSYAQFVDLLPWLDPRRTILLDGEDTQAIAPFAGRWWRRPECWLWPNAHTRAHYFKREWGGGALRSRAYRLIPESWGERWTEKLGLLRTAFSIPEEKIVRGLPVKTKNFPAHIVDTELADTLGHSSSAYKFTTESAYYGDLQASRFGITTKRAGWDCLRHYEIAANAAVPCFRDLRIKPETCAPHGLHEGNCLIYSSAADLLKKIESLSTSDYDRLQVGALEWVREQTTVRRAESMLQVATAR